MKRSEVNALIEDALVFFKAHHFLLPKWAYWEPAQWKGKADSCAEIVNNMLGWDITDFSSGDFEKVGLLLFTMRNGNVERDRKPYAEKIMIVEENQETPFHYHWHKMEDIINRGGGNLLLELYMATEDDELSDAPFDVQIDGETHSLEPGSMVRLEPGQSICLYQRLYHRFYGEPGKGRVLVGEVSQVNDDRTDNRFKKELGRFPGIEEDAEPLHLLATDYPNYL